MITPEQFANLCEVHDKDLAVLTTFMEEQGWDIGRQAFVSMLMMRGCVEALGPKTGLSPEILEIGQHVNIAAHVLAATAMHNRAEKEASCPSTS